MDSKLSLCVQASLSTRLFCYLSLLTVLVLTSGCGKTTEPGGTATTGSTDVQVAEPKAPGTDWTQFRGPNNSVAISTGFPTEFDTSNVVWKSELIGRGCSTPIILGDKIFLTAYSGYGESFENPGSKENLRLHIFCFNRIDGKLVWQRDIKGNPVTERLSKNMIGHGFASSTMITDGKNVYAFFGVAGVFAYDVDGKFLWQRDVGWESNNFGSSASLAIYKELLIVNASIESRAIYALNKETGVGVWRLKDVIQSWSTPIVGKSPDGNDEMIIAQEHHFRGVNPDTGEELWRCEGIPDYVVPTPVIVDGVAYCNGGQENRTMAIRLGGRGDVTKSHKLWETRVGTNVPSAIVHEDAVYLMRDQGIFQTVDAKTGETINRGRLKNAGTVYGSPLLAGDRILFPLTGGVLVTEAKSEFSQIAINKFASEDAEFRASLAVSGDRLFTRNDKFLYCIGPDSVETSLNEYDKSKVDESTMIVSKQKFDWDAKGGRVRVYNRCIGEDLPTLEMFFLNPYKSVITPEQNEKSLAMIKEVFPDFVEIGKERSEVFWNHLSQAIDGEEFEKQMTAIETKAMAMQRDVRGPIKKMFSKEQMDKHLEEARKWQEAQAKKKKGK